MINLLQQLPPKVRLYTYIVLGLAAIVVAAFQASDGDWLTTVGLVLGALGFGTAASNIPSGGPSE